MIRLIKLIGLLDLGMFALLHETFSYNKYSGCLKTLNFLAKSWQVSVSIYASFYFDCESLNTKNIMKNTTGNRLVN